MGSLNETASWDASVPYFAADAILTGGPDCPDNIPIQALTNRTAFLKKQIDDAVSGALVTMSAKKLQTARNIAMTGDGTWNVSFDGSGNATASMALSATGVAAGTYPVVTVDSKGRVIGGRTLTAADVPPVDVSKITGAASESYVQQAISNLLNGAPGALDTLQELAAALGNDANFAATIANALAGKASLAGSAAQAFSVLSATQGQHAASFAQLTGVVGSTRKLRMYLPAAASSAQITAETIIAETAAGLQYKINGFNKTLNLATTGIGGVDTGAAPVNGYLAIYGAYNPATGDSGVFAANATLAAAGSVCGGANAPAGYTATALLTVVPTNASGQIKPCLVRDRRVSLQSTSVLTTSTTAGSFTSLSIAGAVPLNAVSAKGYPSFSSSTSSAQGVVVAGDVSGIDAGYGSVSGAAGGAGGFDVQMASAQTIFYTFSCTSGTPSLNMFISGYTI
jgi:hypothetical protein